MTKEETLKVLAVLNAFYAGGKNDPKAQVTAWHLVMGKYDYNDAMAAVLRFAENDTRDYATFPAVGKIIAEIKAEERRKQNAINMVIRGIGYGRSYDMLSEDAKSLIPEESYNKWLKIDAEEFAEKQKAFAEFLKKRQLQLEGDTDDKTYRC